MSENGTNKRKKGNSGMWQPGQSGNPAGRPKRKNVLTEGLEISAQSTFAYWEDGKQKRRKKADFITDLVLGALTTGFFEFPAADEGAEKLRIPVSSSDLMKLVQFYFSRLEGTPKKVEPEPEDNIEKMELTPEELEEIRKDRWEGALDQIAELIDGEDTDAGGPETQTQ